MHHLIGSNVLSEEVVKDDANIGLKISNPFESFHINNELIRNDNTC